MNPLAKTRKRSPTPSDVQDVSGTSLTGFLQTQSSQFMNFLNSHAESAYARPWHRLEHGLRLNRIRLFVQEESERCALSEEDKTALFQMLSKSLDKKLLNSKNIVTYDIDQQKILELKNLVSHKRADGKIIYQFIERKNATSKRKVPTTKANLSTTQSSSVESGVPSEN